MMHNCRVTSGGLVGGIRTMQSTNASAALRMHLQFIAPPMLHQQANTRTACDAFVAFNITNLGVLHI